MSGLENRAEQILEAERLGMAKRPSKTPYVELHRAADMPMKPIRWLWAGWLARGKLHLIGGAPGTGKTTIGIAMVATITSGGRWPDGTRAKVGNAIIWSGEDDPTDTLVPRLAAAGADLARVYFVLGTAEGGERRSFDPATDVALLAAKAAEIGNVAIMLVDPVVSAVEGDSHKNSEVRRSLQPLVDMAADLDAAMIGVTHFSKGSAGRDPVERILGSVAFGALPRVVMVAAKRGDDEDGPARMLARAKSNIGPDGGGFGYDLEMVAVQPGIEASRVLWGAALTGSARELLGVAEAEPRPRNDAVAWLQDELANGPVPVKELRANVKGSGASWRTVESAKAELGVIVRRVSDGNRGGGFWTWQLPGAPGSNPAAATPQSPRQNLAVLQEASNGAGFLAATSATPQDAERGIPCGLATPAADPKAIAARIAAERGLA